MPPDGDPVRLVQVLRGISIQRHFAQRFHAVDFEYPHRTQQPQHIHIVKLFQRPPRESIQQPGIPHMMRKRRQRRTNPPTPCFVV